MGGAVLLAGLLVGASLAFAQEGEDPEESSLGRLFGAVEDAASPDAVASDSLEGITADLLADIEPLVDQIRDRIIGAVDEAVAADIVTEEEGAALKERIEAFELPDELPFPLHRFDDERFSADGECFGFRFGPDGAEVDGDCPDFGDGFPFGPRGFGFEGRPFGLFDGDGFLEDLDFDLDGLMERLESGMNLDEALQDLDIDLEGLLSEARQEAAAELEKLVEDGTLTRERADWIKDLLEGFDLGGGFPFGLHDLDFGEFGFDDFDIDGFDFEGFDLGEFDFDRFRGPRGHGEGFHFFFGDDGSTEDVNADNAVLDV